MRLPKRKEGGSASLFLAPTSLPLPISSICWARIRRIEDILLAGIRRYRPCRVWSLSAPMAA